MLSSVTAIEMETILFMTSYDSICETWHDMAKDGAAAENKVDNFPVWLTEAEVGEE